MGPTDKTDWRYDSRRYKIEEAAAVINGRILSIILWRASFFRRCFVGISHLCVRALGSCPASAIERPLFMSVATGRNGILAVRRPASFGLPQRVSLHRSFLLLTVLQFSSTTCSDDRALVPETVATSGPVDYSQLFTDGRLSS